MRASFWKKKPAGVRPTGSCPEIPRGGASDGVAVAARGCHAGSERHGEDGVLNEGRRGFETAREFPRQTAASLLLVLSIAPPSDRLEASRPPSSCTSAATLSWRNQHSLGAELA
jgi:hypothetical protein